MNQMKLGLIGIVNEATKNDYWGTMQHVADAGYHGVEGAIGPLGEGDVGANLKRLNDIGLQLLTTSAKRESLRDGLDQVIEEARALRVKRVSCWWGPAESREQILQDAELYNTAGKRLADEGIRLAYHHHDHEFKTSFDGVRAFDLLVAHTDPTAIGFVIDIAWAAIGGEDPAALINRLGSRVTSLHVKDVIRAERDAENKVPWTAVGTGCVPIESALRAAIEQKLEWAVVEQDKLRNLDPFETITVSALNLKETGLVG